MRLAEIMLYVHKYRMYAVFRSFGLAEFLRADINHGNDATNRPQDETQRPQGIPTAICNLVRMVSSGRCRPAARPSCHSGWDDWLRPKMVMTNMRIFARTPTTTRPNKNVIQVQKSV